MTTMVDRSRVADAYPISPSQAGLLFESLKAGEEPRHLEQYAYLLRGQLDSDRLRRAFESVVARHDALRSMLRWEKVETPLQIVLRAVDVPWAELDLRGLPSREQELRVDAFLSERRLEGIDPRRAPPLDVSLLRVEDNATWLVVGFHHALLDGWSYAGPAGDHCRLRSRWRGSAVAGSIPTLLALHRLAEEARWRW